MLELIYLFLAEHQPSLGHYRESSLIHSISQCYSLLFIRFLLEDHQEHSGIVLTLHLVQYLVQKGLNRKRSDSIAMPRCIRLLSISHLLFISVTL